MRCPICEMADSRVTNTVKAGFEVYKKRKCNDPECEAVFFTRERECSEADYIKARERVTATRKQVRAIWQSRIKTDLT